MFSVLIATIGYVLLAFVFILDKIILSKSVSKPVVYTFYSTIFLLAVFLLYPLGVQTLFGVHLFWALFSGLTFGFALWFMFIAIKKGETSHISPFIGGIITVATYIISYFVLSEQLSTFQLFGIGILIFSSFLLSFEKSRKHNGFHIGFVWAIGSGILFALSHVSAKYIYELYPFLTGIVWTRGTTGLVGIITLFFPSVLKTFKKRKRKRKTKGKKHVALLIIVTKILGVLANLLVQYALAIGSVTIVMALSGLQFALMFLFILLLTKFLPKIFREYFTRREIFVQTTAILLVVVGYIFFVF
ncbi:MAG: DMT family transporter [Candidatus Magasanikbacteria bacterium]|nr:DMT family transporter [Candidatus Magasanikbacteria bacterium]